MTENNPPVPRLLSFLDAMCSWCYGFVPELERVRAHFEARLDHLTFAGGLRPFTKEPMADEMRAKLAATYDVITANTGQIFQSDAVLRPGFIYDTEPASRAIVTMRHLAPGLDYSYYLTIQRAFYAQGEDITRAEVLAAKAATFDVQPDEFLAAFQSDEMRNATLGDFQVAQNFGIDGFPTLILHRMDGKNPNALMMIARGFTPADEVIERIEAALAADV